MCLPDVQEEGFTLQRLDAAGGVRGRPVRPRVCLGQQSCQLLYVKSPPVRHVILRHRLYLWSPTPFLTTLLLNDQNALPCSTCQPANIDAQNAWH